MGSAKVDDQVPVDPKHLPQMYWLTVSSKTALYKIKDIEFMTSCGIMLDKGYILIYKGSCVKRSIYLSFPDGVIKFKDGRVDSQMGKTGHGIYDSTVRIGLVFCFRWGNSLLSV